MDRPKLLITGINGLIGSILREDLGDSYDLCGLDRVGPFLPRFWKPISQPIHR